MNLINNMKWNSISQFFKVLVQLFSMIYLARIIPPAEYGLMAISAVFISFGILLRDLGTTASIIQKKDLDNSLINSVFWMNIFLGSFLLACTFLMSPFIATFYNQPKIKVILYFLSLNFIFSSASSTQLALLERSSKFKVIAIVEIITSILSLLVAIVMANNDFGVYSLVAQSLTLSITSCSMFIFLSDWKPSLSLAGFHNNIRSIFGFSYKLTIFSILNFFSRNADSFIIGRFMSASILGNYNLAYRIMLFPLQSLTFVASRSLLPILSHNQDDLKKVSTSYFNCLSIIVFFTIPIMGLIGFYSKPLVNIIFGNEWLNTAIILKWLAPTAIIQSILSTTGAVFTAKGRTDTLMKLGMLGVILQLSAFIVGANFSIQTFAMLYFVANVINFIPVMSCLLNLIGENFKSLSNHLLPFFFSGILMIVFSFSLSKFFPVNDIRDIFSLIYITCSSLIFYLLTLLVTHKKIKFKICNHLGKFQ